MLRWILLATVVSALWSPRAEQPTGLSAIEQVRAHALRATLEPRPACRDDALLGPTSACVRDGHADVDSDGRVDCWREQRGGEMEPFAVLSVWRGCRDEPVRFEVRDASLTLLAIPPELASPLWLRWIATRLAGEAIACTAIAGCPAPGPEWQWVLDSALRRAAEPGHQGTVAPRWHTGARSSGPAALVLPWVGDGWMQRLRGPEEPEPEVSRAGARIVVDAARGIPIPPVRCGGLDVHAEDRGIVGTDARGRWTWLFRGLADHGYRPRRLLCREGLVIATTHGNFADVVVIEPSTGGWLFDRSSDCCPGARVVPTFAEDALYQRDHGTVVSLRQLRAWLALPAAARPSLLELGARPELAHESALFATLVARTPDRPGDELWGAWFEGETIESLRTHLPGSLGCAGHRIAWSGTAVLAERRTRARWVLVEAAGSTRRIASVRCARGQLEVTRSDAEDLLEEQPRSTTDVVEVDLRRGRWRYGNGGVLAQSSSN